MVPGDPARGECHLPGVRRAPPDLRVFVPHGQPGGAGRHHDGRDLPGPARVTPGDGQHRDQRGDRGPGVGDERLGPVDDPFPVHLPRSRLPARPPLLTGPPLLARRPAGPLLQPRGGPHPAGDVRPPARLGQAERGQAFPRAQFRQPAAPLGVGAEPIDRHGPEGYGGLERDGHRGVHPGQFLQGQAEGEQVTVHPAELRRERQPEQAQLGHPRDQVIGELGALVVAADDRPHHVTGERGHGLAEFLMLIAECITDHGCLSPDGNAG